MRIVVSGGGTAGHVSPVLATVDALRKSDPRLEFIYIGQAAGIEAELARAAGLRFVSVCGGKFRRLPGAGLWRNLLQLDNLALNLRDIFLIAIGSLQAWWVLRRLRPQAVFNKAGPTGLPVGLACRVLGIPMVIHEPDVIPGVNNRMLSRWAAAIAVGFPKKLYPQLPADKLHYTGNPVGPAILKADKATAIQQFSLNPKRPVVVIAGGSQGALAINEAVAEILPDLIQKAQVVHVAGREGYIQAQAAAQKKIGASPDYHVVAFLPMAELGALYRAATIVVGRAGANTIAELAALAKPVILLPNHQAAAHQIANARWLATAAAAVVLPNEQPEPLLAAITKLLAAPPATRQQLATHIAACYVADASQRLAALVLKAAGSRQ
ncbi:MAG TPA: UDP-N-acetylglucosamine--N-acetylmuramyl-(pentapeptide) pyrophosphoryl-undecaprenol N-acetylglucosamine transferase [Candidatus Saccharimonadales bacterium]|nr:UDP-N-acetylglucosamine--N-acetylmuramyl-(pentapeptide) pyrophosphoryl-undecaprenol N-acetylglucosamine transferase [Candidatus Saccharimonadales bacterium]